MPNPSIPEAAWEVAEKKEMEQVVELYGKVYHLWQTDMGHAVPLGKPKLMTSFTEESQLPFKRVMEERDSKFGVNCDHKKEVRKGIPVPAIHPGEVLCQLKETATSMLIDHLDADSAWK